MTNQVAAHTDDLSLTGPLPALLAALREGLRRPEELIDEVRHRHDMLLASPTGDLGAFLAVDFALGYRNASALVDIDAHRHPLYGYPLTLKDLEPTADLPTTLGLAPETAGHRRLDGLVAARARSAGAVLFAKTNTPALGHKDVTDTTFGPPARNPWDPTRTAGGSSGGAAVVVATGLGQVAHGTDAAGSVRMPAALCGIVGFKPSYGAIPRVPSDDLWAARGHHGLLARRATDLEPVLRALGGADRRDPLSVDPDWDRPAPQRPRVAFAHSLFQGCSVDPGVLKVLEAALSALERLGFRIDVIDPQWENPLPWSTRISSATAHLRMGADARRRPEAFTATHRHLIAEGAGVTVADLVEATAHRNQLYRECVALWNMYDFVLTPTLPRVAWPIDEHLPAVAGRPVTFSPRGRWADVLIANLTGWPAASVPAGLDQGLPVGLHVLGPWRGDGELLDLVCRIEQVLGPVA